MSVVDMQLLYMPLIAAQALEPLMTVVMKVLSGMHIRCEGVSGYRKQGAAASMCSVSWTGGWVGAAVFSSDALNQCSDIGNYICVLT